MCRLFERKRGLNRNCGAVSEVLGEVLLTGIVVLMMGSLNLFICSTSENIFQPPHANVAGWVNPSKDTVYICHGGGEIISVEDIEIAVNLNDKRRRFVSDNISNSLGHTSTWELGDIITINTSEEWGIPINKKDSVELYIVDKPSRHVVQKISLSPAMGAC